MRRVGIPVGNQGISKEIKFRAASVGNGEGKEIKMNENKEQHSTILNVNMSCYIRHRIFKSMCTDLKTNN